MYRARVQAVSGNKIYADGKWLTCIGNKNFRAGEMVWTDGRCAYGHFQESQQPPIITAPQDDEGIPIFIPNGTCYTFQNKKLKQVAETNFRYMSLINNKNKVFVHPYLAANIDNQGNIFVMAETYKTDKRGRVTEDKVVIFKSDKTSPELKFSKVKDIDLLAWFNDEVAPKCPEAYSGAMDVPLAGDFDEFTGHHYTPRENGYYASTGGALYIRRAFIEDDNNFEFIVDAGLSKSFHDAGDIKLASSSYEILCQFKNDEKNIIYEQLSIGEVGYRVTESGYLAYIKDATDADPFRILFTYTYPIDVKNTIPCSVGDGYYYTIMKERLQENVDAGVHYAGGEYRYNFFTPDGIKLAETHGGYTHTTLARKIGSNYLIIVSGALKIYEIFGKKLDDRDTISGIYLYSSTSKELKLLKYRTGSSNQRLRPMKKIKGWQNYIKEISLDLEQDEN